MYKFSENAIKFRIKKNSADKAGCYLLVLYTSDAR